MITHSTLRLLCAAASAVTMTFGAAAAPVALTMPEIQGRLADDSGALRQMITGIEDGVSRGDSVAFDAALDRDGLLERATKVNATTVKPNDEIKEAFCNGTRNSWASRSLASDYLRTHFRFVRAQEIAGRAGLLFRAAGENGALNYCLLTLAAEGQSETKVDDIYVVGLSEFVSDTIRRGYLTLAQSMEPQGESGKRAALYVENLPKIIDMNKALLENDFPKVLAVASTLPPAVQKERSVMLIRLNAADHVSLAEKSAVFTEWRQMHPDEMSLPLRFADHHIAMAEYDQAEALLKRLDERIGGDSYVKLRIGEARMMKRRAAQIASAKADAAPTDVAVPARVQ